MLFSLCCYRHFPRSPSLYRLPRRPICRTSFTLEWMALRVSLIMKWLCLAIYRRPFTASLRGVLTRRSSHGNIPRMATSLLWRYPSRRSYVAIFLSWWFPSPASVLWRRTFGSSYHMTVRYSNKSFAFPFFLLFYAQRKILAFTFLTKQVYRFYFKV